MYGGTKKARRYSSGVATGGYSQAFSPARFSNRADISALLPDANKRLREEA